MSIGQQLSQAREECGLTVEDVSRQTRIRGTLIRAIESDEFGPCGGAVYARGHIRSIAHSVGLEPEPLIADYDKRQGGPPGGVVPLAIQPFDPEIEHRSRRRQPNWTAAAVICLLFIIAFAAADLISHNTNKPLLASSGLPNPPPTPTETVAPPASAQPTPAGAGALAQINPNVVTIELRALTGTTWLSVTNSAGTSLFQGLVNPGQTKLFTDPQSLALVVGNAPVVDLIVNGHDLHSPSSSSGGVVYRHTFTPGDPTAQTGAG
ncbi:MAG TPA: RodZ domain-containing protein [Mycobacteriales bacterium]|nr:RodZ domain-containing protein [Mycobacteriales bacterium]